MPMLKNFGMLYLKQASLTAYYQVIRCARYLRLEMGMCLYGNDIDDTTSPMEAGLGWITKFTKDFVSSETFAKQKEEGVTKKLSALK